MPTLCLITMKRFEWLQMRWPLEEMSATCCIDRRKQKRCPVITNPGSFDSRSAASYPSLFSTFKWQPVFSGWTFHYLSCTCRLSDFLKKLLFISNSDLYKTFAFYTILHPFTFFGYLTFDLFSNSNSTLASACSEV